MTTAKKSLALVLFAITVLVAVAPTAQATLVSFVHEGVGAGTLDGVPFPASAFTISALADTDDRFFYPNIYELFHLSSSISIDGLGTFDFLSPTRTFVNNDTQGVGFSGPDRDLFDGPQNPAFATWDMTTPIGPFSGSGIIIQWGISTPIQTTGGVLRFFSSTSPVTFQAIPEPSTLALLGAMGLGVVVRRRGRRRRDTIIS
jgi:hypothetical protein